jgi:hypothetical protein
MDKMWLKLTAEAQRTQRKKAKRLMYSGSQASEIQIFKITINCQLSTVNYLNQVLGFADAQPNLLLLGLDLADKFI